MHQPDRRQASPLSGDGVYIDCRVCWRHIKLDPTRVEIDSAQVVYRCQNCGETFAIRDDDAIALGVRKGER